MQLTDKEIRMSVTKHIVSSILLTDNSSTPINSVKIFLFNLNTNLIILEILMCKQFLSQNPFLNVRPIHNSYFSL